MERLTLRTNPSIPSIPEDHERRTATSNIGQFKASLNKMFGGRPIQTNKPTLKDWHDLAGNIMALGTSEAYTAPETYTYGAFNRLMVTVLATLKSPEFRTDHLDDLNRMLTQQINARIFLSPSASLAPMVVQPRVLRQSSVPMASAGSVEANPSALQTSQAVPRLIRTIGREVLPQVQKEFWQPQLAEPSLIYVANQKEAEAARVSLTRLVLEHAREFSDEEANPIVYLDSPEGIVENLQELRVNPEGKYELVPGRLRRILDSGGVILINFENFDAAATARLNSLFDDERKLDGIPLNPKVKVIGLLQDKSVIQGKKSEAFFSRCKL